MQALGIDSGISKSEVSRICAKLDLKVDAFRNRSLAHVEFPYVYLDATYVKARDTDLHQVVSRAVVIATGITAGGDREVACLCWVKLGVHGHGSSGGLAESWWGLAT